MTFFRRTILAAFSLAMMWCAFGPSLRSAAPTKDRRSNRDPRPIAVAIDNAINRRLAEAKVPASPLADDAEFLRRLSLDICGRVPTVERTIAFLADTDPDKRRKLVDEFLADGEYGEHFGRIWYHRMARPTMDNQRLLSEDFRKWLAERFNKNDSWDAIVHDIMTASGDRDKNPATVFWLAHVEGMGRRDVVPARANAAASHLFLGVKLECCECHNHMFDSTLKQTDFWGMAAFMNATHAENAGKNDDGVPSIKESVPPRTANTAFAAKLAAKAKNAKIADKLAAKAAAATGSIVIPDSKGQTVKARFLHGDTPTLTGKDEYRPTLAAWMIAPKNPYFAKAIVNKVWANFFGRGIVNPIDDMREDAANSHPDLLKALAAEFTASGSDLKHLTRCICNSESYQRTSQPLPENRSDEELYSHMKLKVMSADMLYDSLTVVLAHEPAATGRGLPKAIAAKAKGPLRKTGRDEFRAFFHAEADDDVGVVEDYTHGIPQALRLMNSQQMNDTALIVARLKRADSDPAKIVEGLYLRILSRRPTAAETERMTKFVAESRDPAKGFADVVWVLVNSSEFLFNH